jgi:AmmeMemoRadiSam system protein A
MGPVGKDVDPPELARIAVERYVSQAEIIEPPPDLLGVLAEAAGAFVTLRTTEHQLRGCIGTILPTRSTVAEEIIHNAISACSCDPRFPPVTLVELTTLTYGVDVLAPPEPVGGPEDLDPSRYGVIIETLDRRRRGLLLPGITGIETIMDQWLAVHQKAGVRLGTSVYVERFTVTRFGKD